MFVFVWYTILCILSSFAIVLKRTRELVALLLLFYGYLVAVNVLWLFLTVPWVNLQCVIVVFPDYTHLHFATCICMSLQYLSVEIILSDLKSEHKFLGLGHFRLAPNTYLHKVCAYNCSW